MPRFRRKGRLFWRLFFAFLATLLVTVFVLSALVVVLVREERSNALANEVRVQARDVARLLQQFDESSAWWRDTSVSTTLDWKIEEIYANYGAEVWLVSAGRLVWVLGDKTYDHEQLNGEQVVTQINRVLAGEEILVQGLIPELGDSIVTVGVPWNTRRGAVGGAVLLHIATDSLFADYGDLIKYAGIAAAVAMVLGALLALVISKRQTEPLLALKRAVTDFAAGQFDRRVSLKGDSELVELGDAFNQMAADLANLEASRRSFVASVSHELRSPLTCISGYVEGMLDGTIPESAYAKYLGVVRSETQRLTRLVNELLDLSKIEAGTLPVTLARFDLCETLRLELLKFEGRIDEKQLDVAVELPDAPVYVQADEERIRQVLINLIDNAVKFVPPQGRLGLSITQAGDTCRVTVFNTGAPIPPDDLPHIFDRFYKADKAHTSGGGTGLGLAIAQRIIEQHGQKISVTSDGAGTRFSFDLALDY